MASATAATPDEFSWSGSFVEDMIGVMPVGRSPLPPLASTSAVGGVVTTAATFLPWASSGARTRSSYAVIDVAGRAGVLSDSTEGLSNLWYLLPLLCGLVLVGAALRSVLVVAATAGTIGAMAVAGGLLVARSPLGAEPGLYLAVGVGIVTAGTGIGTLIMTMRRST